MRIVILFIVLCILWHDVNCQQAKIVGGTTTSITAYKFIVQIREHGSPMCGGSLVSAIHVVTAAHCVEDSGVNQYSVKAGATFLDGTGGQIRRVTQKWIHPRYNWFTLAADLAVLKLGSRVSGANIAIIPLCTALPANGAQMRGIGWGLINENGRASNQLRHVTLPRVSPASCRSTYGSDITASMFCAGEAGKDTCQGDSGGPLINAQNRLCGVASWGNGCGRRGYPGVYTSIVWGLSFVREKMAL